MTHIKGERREDFDRLHHADGTHRESARSAAGQEVEFFENHIREHLAAHEGEQMFHGKIEFSDCRTAADIRAAVEEALDRIEGGNTSGFDRNEDGRFTFEVNKSVE